MAGCASRAIESRIAESTTIDEARIDTSAAERGTSRDEVDASPADSKSGAVTDTDYVCQTKTPTRFRLSNNWKTELLSSEVPDVMPVKCGDLEGELHVQLLGSGSRGPCIHADGEWLTPNQFECKGGHGYFRYWKRSIRHGRKPLDCYLKLGLIKLHPRFCSCQRCSAPIVDAPQRLRLNKGKKRRRDREQKEPNESQRDDGLGMSESESHSEADSGNEEGKRWRDGSRRDSIESANHDDRPTAEVAAATTQRTPRGRKRSRLEQLLENGQGNGGNRRNRLCDSRLVRGNSKDSPLESSNQTEQESITGSSTSAVTPNAMSCFAPNSFSAGREDGTNDSTSAKKTVQSEYVRRNLFPVRERQSFDLELVASASASLVDLNGARSLRSQKASNASKVGETPDGNVKQSEFHGASADATHVIKNASQSPSLIRRESGMSSRKLALRSRILVAVRKAGVDSDVKRWSVDDVAAFMRNVGFKFQSSLFREHLINGEALMRVQEKHLLETFKVKLGTALCLFSVIHGLQVGLAARVD